MGLDLPRWQFGNGFSYSLAKPTTLNFANGMGSLKINDDIYKMNKVVFTFRWRF